MILYYGCSQLIKTLEGIMIDTLEEFDCII